MKTKVYLSILVLISFISTLRAQDAGLFEHTWYLHDLIVDGESNVPPINADIPYVPAIFSENGNFGTGVCGGGGGILEYFENEGFYVLELGYIEDECPDMTSEEFEILYQNFWDIHFEFLVPYQITQEGDIRTLVITNENEDTAIYRNDVPLATEEFSANAIQLYPNPVKNELYIHTLTPVKRTLEIYTLSGQRIQTQQFLAPEIVIDVHKLNTGMYFVVVTTEKGQRYTQKFVKQ